MAIDVARLKQLREEFGDIPLPEGGFGQFDIADGRHAAQIIDVGTRVTREKQVPQLYLQWKIVSQSRDKGHTPYMTFQLPTKEKLQAAVEAGKQEDVDKQLMGFTIFNSVYEYTTGLPQFANLGAVLLALETGDLKGILVGKKAELEATHNGPYLQVKVRRAIGLSPSEVSRPMPEPKSKSVRRRIAVQKKKLPARRKK